MHYTPEEVFKAKLTACLFQTFRGYPFFTFVLQITPVENHYSDPTESGPRQPPDTPRQPPDKPQTPLC